jgi:hypothetical protein
MKVLDVFIFSCLLPVLYLIKLELFQLRLFLTYFFFFESLSLLEFLTTSLPELLEVFLLLALHFTIHFAFLDLMFTGLFDGCLELSAAGLLLFEEATSLFLCFSYLLVQDLLLLALQLREVDGLLFDHLLSDLLLFLESLGFTVLLQLINVLLLLGIFVLSALMFVLTAFDFLFISFEVLIGLIKFITGTGLLGTSLEFLETGGFEVFTGLALDELSLHDLILHLLYIVHLRLVELVLDDFSCILLSLVHLFKPLLHPLVVLLHLYDVILDPALFDSLVLLEAALLKFNLSVSLLKHIAHEHLRVEGLDLVLRFIGLPVCLLQGLPTFLLVEGFFLFIDTSPSQL